MLAPRHKKRRLRQEEGENWGGGRQPRDECRSLSYSSNCQTNQHKTPNTKHKQQTQNTGSFDTSGSMIALAVPEIHCTQGFCDGRKNWEQGYMGPVKIWYGCSIRHSGNLKMLAMDRPIFSPE